MQLPRALIGFPNRVAVLPVHTMQCGWFGARIEIGNGIGHGVGIEVVGIGCEIGVGRGIEIEVVDIGCGAEIDIGIEMGIDVGTAAIGVVVGILVAAIAHPDDVGGYIEHLQPLL